MPVLLIATAVTLAALHQEAVGKWTIVSDETMYVLESVWIRQPGYTWHVDPDILPFLLMRKAGLAENGGIMGMYTPGWPALLSLFSAVGLRWWSAVILGTGSVYVTYRLGVALHSRAVGVLAALLIATNPIFHILHPGYLAHPATIFLLATATLLLIESETRQGSGRLVRWFIAGVLLSLAIASRALTGTAVTVSLAVWILMRQRMSFADMMRCAAVVSLGALPILGFFLHFNYVTAGSPFKLSYQALHGSGFNLGFGSRGFLGYDSEMHRVRIPVEFTPKAAIGHFLGMVLGTNLNFVAYALLAPLVVLFAHYGYKPRWPVLAAFLLLPFLHFFYWATGLRFYSELLPLLLVWIAAGIFYVAKENAALAGRLTIALVVCNIVLAVPVRATAVPLSATWAHSAYSLSDGRFATFRRLESMAKERGRLLVFVTERVPLMDIMLDHLYQFNEKGVNSEIFVVRDLGARNAALMRKFPDRLPLLIRDTGRDTEAIIEELPRVAASPAPVARPGSR